MDWPEAFVLVMRSFFGVVAFCAFCWAVVRI